jgi:hypothetical protein
MQQHDKDVLTWAGLVADLQMKSVTQGHISQLLGYSGSDGPRDLDNFAKGRSFTMTIPEGIDVLRRYLRQVEISQEAALQRMHNEEAQDALPPKASVDPESEPPPIDYFRTVSKLLAQAVPFSRIYAQLLPEKAMPDTRKAAAAELEAFIREATDEEIAGSLPLREGLFRLCLAAAVDCFAQGRPASVMCEALERLPADGKPATLSSWLHAATKAEAYTGRTQVEAVVAARTLADGVLRASAALAATTGGGAHASGKVRVWMLDGAGDAVFGLLRTLKESSWSDDEIDTRLEVTLVERKRKMNGFHEHAIPCVTARRGDIHAAVEGCDAAAAARRVLQLRGDGGGRHERLPGRRVRDPRSLRGDRAELREAHLRGRRLACGADHRRRQVPSRRFVRRTVSPCCASE